MEQGFNKLNLIFALRVAFGWSLKEADDFIYTSVPHSFELWKVPMEGPLVDQLYFCKKLFNVPNTKVKRIELQLNGETTVFRGLGDVVTADEELQKLLVVGC